MTEISDAVGQRPLLPTPTQKTAAEVVALLENVPGLNADRRRDLISAVNCLCAMLQRDPTAVVMDPVTLRHDIAGISPARFGISPQTWHNRKANIAAAMRQVGVTGGRATDIPLTPDWLAFRHALPNKRMQNGLSRLVHYANAQGLKPSDVDDAFFTRFMAHVSATTLKAKPTDLYREAAKCWNIAVDMIEHLGLRTISVPDFRAPRRSRPLSDFPLAFQQEVQRHLRWLAGTDLFADRPPPHRCRPATIKMRGKQIELAASILVDGGVPIDRITGLEVLVEVEQAKMILRRYIGNDPDHISAFTFGMAKMLISIARHWVVVEAAHLDKLRMMKRQLGPERTDLTDKNRTTLREVAAPGMYERLQDLPQLMMSRARKAPADDPRAAVEAQVAVAIGILLRAPMRAKNLINLRLDQNVLRPGGARGEVFIALPAEEVKNREAAEYVLGADGVVLLDRYLKDFRPRLCGHDCPWLFPAIRGGRKAQATLSQQIVEAIWEGVGLRVTVHQLRHVAAMVILDEEPGNFELARQLLGHKTNRTTVNFYTGLQTAKAARHYDDLVARRRDRHRVRPAARGAGGPKRSPRRPA